VIGSLIYLKTLLLINVIVIIFCVFFELYSESISEWFSP